MARKLKPKRYRIQFDIDLDTPGVRAAQIENWIRYNCGDKGRLRRDNPLYGKNLDPVYGTLKVERV